MERRESAKQQQKRIKGSRRKEAIVGFGWYCKTTITTMRAARVQNNLKVFWCASECVCVSMCMCMCVKTVHWQMYAQTLSKQCRQSHQVSFNANGFWLCHSTHTDTLTHPFTLSLPFYSKHNKILNPTTTKTNEFCLLHFAHFSIWPFGIC